MTIETDNFADGAINVEEYLAVLLRGWWIILSVLVIVLVLAGATSPPQSPDVYEAQTNIAIPSNISGSGILNMGGSVPLGLNPVIAQSDGTLETVIRDAGLRNADTGQPWSVGQLAALISVLPSDSDSPQELTFIVRTQDPALAKRILEVWVEAFVEESSLIIESKLSQSRQLKFSQYEKIGVEFATKQDERLSYLRQNPLASLVSSREASIDQIKNLTGQLSAERGELVKVEPRLESIRDALDVEPRLQDLDQGIKDATLLSILDQEIKILEPQQYSELTLATEVSNDVNLFFRFRQLEVLLESKQEALKESIAFLEREILRVQSDIESQSIEIDAIQLDLKRMDREIGLLEENVNLIGRDLQPSLLQLPDQLGSFLESDPVSEPRNPITSSNPLPPRLIIGGVVGLILGSVLTFAVDYGRRLRKRQPTA